MIYFLNAPELDRIKIGYSGNVDERLVSIRDGAPAEIIELCRSEGGRALEAKLHRAFFRHRVLGEWFSAAPALTDLIKLLAPLTMGDRERLLTAFVGRCAGPKIAFDPLEERAAFSAALAKFISRHGADKMGEVAQIGPQMIRLVKRGRLLGAAAFNRLVRHDPECFAEFFGPEIEAAAA